MGIHGQSMNRQRVLKRAKDLLYAIEPLYAIFSFVYYIHKYGIIWGGTIGFNAKNLVDS